MPSLLQSPTFSQGLARSAAFCAPEFRRLRRDCMWLAAPCLGPQGGYLHDLGPYRRQGVLHNTSLGTAWGTRAGWLKLDGTDDRVDFPNVVTPATTGKLTIAVRVLTVGLPASSAWLMHLHPAGDASVGLVPMAIQSTGAVRFYWHASSYQMRTTATALAVGVPTTLAVTRSGTAYADVRIYFDGVEAEYVSGGSNGTSLVSPAGSWSLGGRIYDNAVNFNAAVQWAAYWPRVLTHQEIMLISRDGAGLFRRALRPLARTAWGLRRRLLCGDA